MLYDYKFPIQNGRDKKKNILVLVYSGTLYVYGF